MRRRRPLWSFDSSGRADSVIDEALDWIQTNRDDPFFIYIHTIDPHEPYDAPLEETPGKNPAADGGPDLERNKQYLPAYDREIAYTDAQVGRLLAAIDAQGQLERTLVVVTADHGEALGRHGAELILHGHEHKHIEGELAGAPHRTGGCVDRSRRDSNG